MVSTIPVAVVHNTLRDCRIGIWVQRGTGHDLTRNTVTNTTVANVTWGLRLDDTGGAITWANVHDNNTFTGWTYGVWINANLVDLTNFRLFWSDLKANGVALQVSGTLPGPNYFNAKCNWWAGISSSPPNNLGPKDTSFGPPDSNPSETGQPVSDYFYYRGWLNATGSSPSTTCGQQ